MSTIPTKPPSGMRDFLAPEIARRRHVIRVVQRVYESFGFVPLETPAIEHLSTLLGKYGPEGDQLLYRLLHRREKLVRALEAGKPAEGDLADEGLRYDLTVPLARVVANHPDLPAHYKRYQIQPVWRADRPAKGRFREFWQCDVDVIGTKSPVADAEVCGAVATVLAELGFADFEIRLNHRELLRALVAESGIAPEQESAALIALDKLDKIGAEGVKQELIEKGFGSHATDRLFAQTGEIGRVLNGIREKELERQRKSTSSSNSVTTPDTGHVRAARLAHSELLLGGLGSERGLRAQQELLELFFVAAPGPAGRRLVFDPTLARGLSYYTGPIFEIAVPGVAGSLGGGGRYDGLIGMFTKRQIPAVGFSLGLERILLLMEERAMFPPLGVGPELLLCRFADVPASEAIRIATVLRTGRTPEGGASVPGLRVEVFADAPALGKQIAYANTIGAPFVGILGGDELAQGTLTVKKLATGEQKSLPVADVAGFVRGTS